MMQSDRLDTATESPIPSSASSTSQSSRTDPILGQAADRLVREQLQLPADWIAVPLAGRSLNAIRTELAAALGSDSRQFDGIVAQAARSLQAGDALLLAQVSAPDAIGTVVVFAPIGSIVDPDDDALTRSLSEQLVSEGAEDVAFTRQDLPAGPALRVDYRQSVRVNGRTVDIVGRKYVVQARSAWIVTMNTDDPARDSASFDEIAMAFSDGG
jgi:hypothetical protein